MKQIIFYTTLLLSLFILFTSCSKEVKDDPASPYVSKPEITEKKDQTDDDDAIIQEFMKEGFIDSSTFRVVIVTRKNDISADEEEIRRRASNRVIATLRRYLISQGKTVDRNTRSGILNLMNQYGHFYIFEEERDCPHTNVYYYDLKKNKIKEEILNL